MSKTWLATNQEIIGAALLASRWAVEYHQLNAHLADGVHPTAAYRYVQDAASTPQFFNLFHCYNWAKRAEMSYVDPAKALGMCLYWDTLDLLEGAERAHAFIHRHNLQQHLPRAAAFLLCMNGTRWSGPLSRTL